MGALRLVLYFLFVSQSIESINARGFAGREDSCHEPDESTEGDNRHDKPERTIEEVNGFSTEACGNEVDEEVQYLSFNHTEDDSA